jgi:hypothetical protein
MNILGRGPRLIMNRVFGAKQRYAAGLLHSELELGNESRYGGTYRAEGVTS